MSMSDDSFASGTSSGSSAMTSLELLQRPPVMPDSPFSDMSKCGEDDDGVAEILIDRRRVHHEDDDDDDVDEDAADDDDDEGDNRSMACCCSCRKPIKERHLLKVRGFHRPWHVRCLRCSVCQVPLDSESSCFYRGRNIYCKTDYIGHRSRAFKCSKCQRVLGPTDWVRKARDHMYHLACFACDACKRQLSTGEEFALHDDRLLCKTHFVETATGSSENDGEDGSGQKQKTKRVRTSFTEEQLRVLHANFRIDSNPDGQDLERIAQQTGLSKRVTQVWFQNSRARQKKHQQTSSAVTSSASGTFNVRLGGLSGCSTSFTNVSVVNAMASPRSPSRGLVQSAGSHHPSAAAVAVLSAAAAASYMNMNLRGGVATSSDLQHMLQYHGQTVGGGSAGATAGLVNGHASAQQPTGSVGQVTATGGETFEDPSSSRRSVDVSNRSELEDVASGQTVQRSTDVAMAPATSPNMVMIHAALHSYRTQHSHHHQQPSTNTESFQVSGQPRQPGGIVSTPMPSLFTPPSSTPMAPSGIPRHLLLATAGVHFRRPTRCRPVVKAGAAEDDGGECYFCDGDEEDIEPIAGTATENNNELPGCFVVTRRRNVDDRTPDSCVDYGFADYYSQTEGDLSLFD